MKQSFCRSGIFHIFKTLGIILTSLTLLSSCSIELEDFSSELKEDNETLTSIKEDSVLRFMTIDELENITVSDIPGDHSGYELTDLTYECTDTIELRALRLDVTATLTSTTQPDKKILFEAEVGPELVSVEYYPSVEVVPAHDNMYHCVYPKVERYRNYSDGSHIGPDEFYDYGHFVTLEIGPIGRYLETSIGKPSYDFLPSVAVLNYSFEEQFESIEEKVMSQNYFENGVFYHTANGFIEYNLNARVTDYDGTFFVGEDFLPIYPESERFGDRYIGINDLLSRFIGNYYESVEDVMNYIPSRPLDTEDSLTEEMVNIGLNVPDSSPSPYPLDSGYLKPGWYFAGINDNVQFSVYLFSKYTKNGEDTPQRVFTMDHFNNFYLQYLVIDGRIIHFDDLIKKDYEGIANITPHCMVNKTSNGYMVKAEVETHLYGEKFKSIYNLNVRGVTGPVDVLDYSSYNGFENKDHNELENLMTRSEVAKTDKKGIPRKDGKKIDIRCQLPNSINNLKIHQTIKRKIKNE